MLPLNRAFVCLLLIIPLASSELKARKLPRDVNVISGKIMSFTGAGQQDLRESIPGEPGVDYPIYSSPPETSFSCFNRHEGYYADVETRCQVFRICSHTDHTGKGFAFLCPNGTLFSQHDFVCDWYRNVPCERSPNYYFMNELLDKSISPHPELLMKDIVAMVNYPIKVIKQQETYKNAFPQLAKLETPTTTQRPLIISFPTRPPINKTPAPIQTTPTPVRNPFESEIRRPQFVFGNRLPQPQQPKVQQPRVQTTPPQLAQLQLLQPEQPQYQQPQIIPSRIESTPATPAFEQPLSEPEPVKLFTPAVSTTSTTTTTPESIPENKEFISKYDPGKIYISSLGELSTDPGSNFNPNTAIILPDKSEDQSPIFLQAGNQEHLLEGHLEPSLNGVPNDVRLNLENIASSVPGNVNSQLALVRDQPAVEGPVIQIPGTLHVSLNYTQKINTALKNVLIPSSAQDQIAINPILSGDGKIVSQIYGQNQFQNNGILKFAHNINSAFHVDNPLLAATHSQSIPKDFFGSKDIAQEQQAASFSGTGKGFEFSARLAPLISDGNLNSQPLSTPSGGQEVQGVGYTKSNIAVSTPASILHSQTIYIPSINLKAFGQPITSSRGRATFKRITNRGRRIQSTTHIIHNQSRKPSDSGNAKVSSSYVNIPGTKISIAKSIEEGFFSVSNYPLLPSDHKAMSFSSIFPGIIIHPGSPFTIKDKSDVNSNFLFPFNGARTSQSSSTTTTARPSTTIKLGNIIASTPIPSLTSIPLASLEAERRADAFSNDDDDENAFFKGVSSYHVPISSVGRLPADIQGTRRR